MKRLDVRWVLAVGVPLLLLLAEQMSLAGYISGDFRIFHRAVGRFLADPALLYAAAPGVVPEAARTLQGYIYPPPGVLFLLPFGALPLGAGFALFSACVLVAAALAVRSWLGWMEQTGGPINPRLRAFLLLMALASGPVMACRTGQVDAFVLLACVAAARLAQTGRGFWAGALLAAGAWLKIYPVLVMVPLLARPDTRRALIAGFAGAAVVVPLLSAPFLPISLWRTYFVDLLPAMSARTIVNVYNQSFGAFVARGDLPHALALDGYDTVALPGSLRAGVLAMGLCVLALAWLRARRDEGGVPVGVALALAAISLIAPLGWGHTYVYALPLQLLLAREGVRRGSPALLALVAAGWGVMAVSANHRFGFAEHSALLWQAVYGRYALVMLVMIVVGSWLDLPVRGRGRLYASAR